MNRSPAIRVLAIVPARGGSKGIVHKNLRLVDGKSLVRRAVECGQSSSRVTLTVVSTDDVDIAREAAEAGARVIMRPDALATDEATTDPTIIHAVLELEAEGRVFEVVVVLQPTSPLRLPGDVDAAVDTLLVGGADTVVSVCDVGGHHPARMYIRREEWLEPCTPEPVSRRRQDLALVYRRNGAVYCTWVEGLLSRGNLMGERIGGLEMPRSRSIDIDEEVDFAVAEAIILASSRELE